MKFYNDKYFWVGLFLGGTIFCILTILLDIVRLVKLYANGVLILP